MADFAPCLAFTIGPSTYSTLGEEGGFVNDAFDTGGATYRGATLEAMRDWLDQTYLTVDDLRSISVQELTAFYGTMYYNPLRGHELPAGIDLSVFDYAVNCGNRRAVLDLQAIVGVEQDGFMGPNTLEAVHNANAVNTINQLRLHRTTFYHACPQFIRYGNGWIARTTRCYQRSVAMSIKPVLETT